MAASTNDPSGWFRVSRVAAAMRLSESDFLRAYIDGHDDELTYWGPEVAVHWYSLLAWAEKFYATSLDAYEAGNAARELIENLLGLDDWTDGLTNRVATNWNLDTLDYEVVSHDLD